MITKEELLERLKAEGIEIGGNPDRMLTHYISLGLIDKPVRFGLGQGKGSVSKFDESVIERIEKIVSMRDKGLTYEQIKERLMTYDDWLSIVKKIMDASKSEEETVSSLKRIPFLEDPDRGQLKLTVDVANHLTGLIVDELCLFFRDRSHVARKEALVEQIYSSMEFCLSNVFHEFEIDLNDYEEYLEGKKRWVFPSHSGRILNEALKETEAKQAARAGKRSRKG